MGAPAGVRAGGAKSCRILKSIAIIIGVVIVAVLLINSGRVGGALCISGAGCIYSSDSGISVDDRESVTVSTGNP